MFGKTLLELTNATASADGATQDTSTDVIYPGYKMIIRNVVTVDSASGGNVVIKVQDSLDGTIWREIVAFSAKSAVATTTEHYTPNMDTLCLMPYIRAIAVVSGTIQFDCEVKILFR